MAVNVSHDRENNTAGMYCSTSGWFFGPVFESDDESSADERVYAFLRWVQTTPNWYGYEHDSIQVSNRRDVRQLTEAGLSRAYQDWLGQEALQLAAEAAADTVDAEDEDTQA